jgi:hypothetical protein
MRGGKFRAVFTSFHFIAGVLLHAAMRLNKAFYCPVVLREREHFHVKLI